MLDIAWSEIAVIAVVALVVIGPKDLPKALYTAGKWVRSARKVAAEFQRHVDDMMREAELEDLKKNIQQTRDFNLKKHLEHTIDPHGELKRSFDPTAGSDMPMKPGWTKPGLEPPAGMPGKPLGAGSDGTPPSAAAPPGNAPVEVGREGGMPDRPAAGPPGGSDTAAKG